MTNHPFVGIPNATGSPAIKVCSSCGELRSAPIHDWLRAEPFKGPEKKMYRITLVLTEISYTGDSPEKGDMLDGDVLEEEDAPGKAGKDFTDETEARLAFKDAQIGIF